MRNSLISKPKFARFGRPALAAAVLALAASASYAGAIVNVTSFAVRGSGPTDDNPLAVQTYANPSGASSSLQVDATNGGASGSATNSYTGTWLDGPNTIAQTSAAVATGNVISFTDALTGLQTGGFKLNGGIL